VHILIATDAQWVLNEIQAVFGSSSTTIQVVTNGRLVAPAVAERTPDIAILDMQVGSMGGMAITMDLRLDYSSGALPNVPILMLLDREADVHMARRSGANGWIIKPLDALRLRKAVNAVVAGGCYAEGIPVPEAVIEEVIASVDETAEPETELLNQ
jgi:DNA-binding response OmpR family regulator